LASASACGETQKQSARKFHNDRAFSFDHLVSGHEEFVRYAQPERLGGLEIDDQLEFCRLLDG